MVVSYLGGAIAEPSSTLRIERQPVEYSIDRFLALASNSMTKKTLDVFITHAWYFHDDWNNLSKLLNESLGSKWRNFSVPWHDPAMVPHTETGKQFIMNYLESQIIPADVVVLLYGVFAKSKPFRKWFEIELELAKKHGKPTIGVPAAVGGKLEDIPKDLVDCRVRWDAREIVDTLYEVSRISQKS